MDYTQVLAKLATLEQKMDYIINRMDKKFTVSTTTQTSSSYSDIVKSSPTISSTPNSPTPGPSNVANTGAKHSSISKTSSSEVSTMPSTPKTASNKPPNPHIPLTRDLLNVLNRRKHAFYSHLRSKDLADIHAHYLSRDVPFIPRKFREKITHMDTSNMIKRKKELEFVKVEHHIETLREYAEKHLSDLKEEDTKATSLISILPTDIKQGTALEWQKCVQIEEEKSNTIWQKKKLFFLQLPLDTNDKTHSNESSEDNSWTVVTRRRQRIPSQQQAQHPSVFRYHHFQRPRKRQPTHMNMPRQFVRRSPTMNSPAQNPPPPVPHPRTPVPPPYPVYHKPQQSQQFHFHQRPIPLMSMKFPHRPGQYYRQPMFSPQPEFYYH